MGRNIYEYVLVTKQVTQKEDNLDHQKSVDETDS